MAARSCSSEPRVHGRSDRPCARRPRRAPGARGARSRERLDALAAELGGLETRVADVPRPGHAPARLVERGDVLVSTVGPFVRLGAPAVEAAIAAGAHYLDSTGEGAVHPRGLRAPRPGGRGGAAAGSLTALGYDCVPGQPRRRARAARGGRARRPRRHRLLRQRHGGRRAAAARGPARPPCSLEPAFRGAAAGRRRAAAPRACATSTSAGGGRPREHRREPRRFALPRVHPALRDVDVYLGWFGPAVARRAGACRPARRRRRACPASRAGLGAACGRSSGLDRRARRRRPGPRVDAVVGRGVRRRRAPPRAVAPRGRRPLRLHRARCWPGARAGRRRRRPAGRRRARSGRRLRLELAEAGTAEAGIARAG